MKQAFQVGDKVKIFSLNSAHGKMNGKIGHVGKVVKIRKILGTNYYILHPHCTGSAWPADCLMLVKPVSKPKVTKTLFNIDDL